MTISFTDSQIKVLHSAQEISQRVIEIAQQINKDYKNLDNLVVVGVLKGAFIFTSDLIRALDMNCQVEFIRLSSYEGTKGSDEFRLYDLTLPSLKDKNILIVEDIVDSGRTAKFLLDFFKNQAGVNTVKLASLFDKPCRRLEELKDIKPDYCCFKVDDKFILGYGLDFDQKYRQLPYIGYVEGLF
jgi:hypoxanthine phosphoribosyltransferase